MSEPSASHLQKHVNGADDSVFSILTAPSSDSSPPFQPAATFRSPSLACSSMTGYKYKVKLIPGTSKRGKSAKQALDAFVRLGGGGAAAGGAQQQLLREADLLRAISDPQLMSTMLGGVKLSVPGLSKLKNADRGARKGVGGGKKVAGEE